MKNVTELSEDRSDNNFLCGDVVIDSSTGEVCHVAGFERCPESGDTWILLKTKQGRSPQRRRRAEQVATLEDSHSTFEVKVEYMNDEMAYGSECYMVVAASLEAAEDKVMRLAAESDLARTDFPTGLKEIYALAAPVDVPRKEQSVALPAF